MTIPSMQELLARLEADAGALGEAAGASLSPRKIAFIMEPLFRRAGMTPWAQGASRQWHLFVNKDEGPTADSKAFVTFWQNPEGAWQLFSGVPTEAFPETRRLLFMDKGTTTSGQAAKQEDALLAAADGKRSLNQNFLLAVAKQVGDSKWVEITRKGGRVIDIAPKAAALGEAHDGALAEGEEPDPRVMIEHGDAMLKIVQEHVDALRKGVAAAQAELKGYARIGVPQRGAAALLKKHLLAPAERLEDTAQKVRASIEEGSKVFE
jgi:hypothetical protein